MRNSGALILLVAVLATACGSGGGTHHVGSTTSPGHASSPLCIKRVHLCSNDRRIFALEGGNEQCLNEHSLSAEVVYSIVRVEGPKSAAGAVLRQSKVALELCADTFLTYSRARCLTTGETPDNCDRDASDLASLVDDYWKAKAHAPASAKGPIALGEQLLNGASPPSQGRARNLIATAAVKALLRNAFLDAHSNLVPSKVKGPIPRTTYYGSVDGSEYALATFSIPVFGTQDQPEVFERPAGDAWQDKGDTGGAICASQIPAALIKAWAIASGGC